MSLMEKFSEPVMIASAHYAGDTDNMETWFNDENWKNEENASTVWGATTQSWYDVPLLADELSMAVMTAVLLPISLIGCATILFLTISDRLVTTNTDKVICAYIGATILFDVTVWPFDISAVVRRVYPNSKSLCQFIEFYNTIYVSAKGLLVATVTAMPFLDAFLRSSHHIQPVISRLPSIIALSFIATVSVVFGSVYASYCQITIINGSAVMCNSDERVVMIVVYIACNLIPGIAACIMSIARVIRWRRYEDESHVTHRVESIAICACFAGFWLPYVCFMAARNLFHIEPVAGFYITRNLAFCDIAVMPLLLLILPTKYNPALGQRLRAIVNCFRRKNLVWRPATSEAQEVVDSEIVALPERGSRR